MKDIKEFVNEKKVEEILKNLIKINSTQPDGNESDIVDYILSIFKDYHIDYRKIDHGENRSSLVITIPGREKDASVSFLGHMDTVPVEDYDKWIYPAFNGQVKDGFMYGRGSADMKGGLTSSLLSLLYILENDIVPSCNIKFCFTADEEYRGKGILAMKEAKILEDSKFIIIPEPTDEKLGIAEKGALWLEVDVEGLSAHGSRPDLGVNAIEYLYRFIEETKKKIQSDESHDLLGKTSISVNEFSGGVSTNVIPTNASASLDIRTIPGCHHQEILDNMKSIAEDFMKKTENLTIAIEVKNNRPALEVSKTNIFVKTIADIFKRLDYDTDYKGLFFYTDGSQIIPGSNIPFIILGPGDDKMAHQRDEKVELSSISRMAEVYINYILEI